MVSETQAPVADPALTAPPETVESESKPDQTTPEQGLSELDAALDLVARLAPEQIDVLMKKVPREKLREVPIIKDELGRERQRLRSRQEYERDTGLSELREVEDLRRQHGEAESALAAALRSENGIEAADVSRHVGRLDGLRKELVERETKVEIANVFDRQEEFELLEDDERARIRAAAKRSPKDYLSACLAALRPALERSLREKLVPEIRKQLEAEVGLIKELQGGERPGAPPRMAGGPAAATTDEARLARITDGHATEDDQAWWDEHYGRKKTPRGA